MHFRIDFVFQNKLTPFLYFETNCYKLSWKLFTVVRPVHTLQHLFFHENNLLNYNTLFIFNFNLINPKGVVSLS